MNIAQPIDRFLKFCSQSNNQDLNHGELLEELDLLLVSANVGEFKFDENEYPDAPDWDAAEIREKISALFPELGYYCTADGDPESIDKAQVLIGDAIDDLVDIVKDLKDVQWYLKNTSINNALWHFQFSYRSHWGLHARELQLHLHKSWW